MEIEADSRFRSCSAFRLNLRNTDTVPISLEALGQAPFEKPLRAVAHAEVGFSGIVLDENEIDFHRWSGSWSHDERDDSEKIGQLGT